MQPNREGFLHPVIDDTKCIDCKLCEKACPGLSPAYNENAERKTFVVQNCDDRVRYESTSGGAFSALAEEIIRRGGIVFGATMTDELKVVHFCVETVEGLAKFRNSKYVQSEIGDSYLQAKSALEEERWVCFSGTPCQINGLIKYLGRDYEKLLTVDVVCKSVPSPLIFEKYVEHRRKHEGVLSDIVFRDKKRGFQYCTMAHYQSHDKRKQADDCYRKGSESDEWLRLFLSGKIARRSCMNCSYQTLQRTSDITLGDIWETGNSQLDDNKGTTLVHAWTPLGKEFLEKAQEKAKVVEMQNRDNGTVRKNTIMLYQNREQLFEDAQKLNVDAFFAKYAPYSMTIMVKQYSRELLWRLNLQTTIRKVKHFIIHKIK
jgi:coenzyme F420-reducing hydrogenase beta subunit